MSELRHIVSHFDTEYTGAEKVYVMLCGFRSHDPGVWGSPDDDRMLWRTGADLSLVTCAECRREKQVLGAEKELAREA